MRLTPLTPVEVKLVMTIKRPIQSWVNGVLQTTIAITDRSVQYGDGFFTTLLAMNSAVYNWQAHWWRLKTSALRLGFRSLDEKNTLSLIASALTSDPTLTSPNTPLAIKLIITRGQSGQGYQTTPNAQPTFIVQVRAHPVFKTYADMHQLPLAIELGLCQTFSSIQPQLAGLKHLNRLENVLAQNELASLGLSEGLMLNANQEVVCATQSNLFLIKGQQLLTPALHNSGVAGTTRYQMADLAQRFGLEYVEKTIFLSEVHSADELFLTNALRGVMPVKQFQTTHYSTNKSLKIHQAWLTWQKQHCKVLNASANH